MTMLRFGPDQGRTINAFGSNFTMAKVHRDDQVAVGCMYLPAGGLVGYHPATCTQVFAVISGQGWVRTGDGERVPVAGGEGIVWQAGDEHAAGSETGMTVLVVEYAGVAR